MLNKTVQGSTRPGQTRHHGPDRQIQNFCDNAILKPFNTNEHHDLSMIVRQTSKRMHNFLPLQMRDLSGFLQWFRRRGFAP